MKKYKSFSAEDAEKRAYRIAWLIAGFIQDRLSPIEHRELDDWVTASMNNQRLFEELTNPANLAQWQAEHHEEQTDKAFQKLKSRLALRSPNSSSIHRRRWPYFATASLVIGIALVWMIATHRNKDLPEDAPSTAKSVKDLPPGTNRAILTLADGTTKLLDSAVSGMLAAQGGALVIKDDSGRLIYQRAGSDSTAETVFNTVKVPRGGQYQLRLSDGTKVWLNAASSLRYPTAFSGSQRQVEVSGEAYFEVAADPNHPFTVRTGQLSVLVLGTAFNVQAYPEERRIAVTLAQGAVKVIPPGKPVTLSPGFQARMDSTGAIHVEAVNLEIVLGWQKGLFIYRDAPIEELMAQLARWYAVDIVYQGTIPQHFNATISRNVPVSKVLHYLEQTGHVHFQIEPDKIIVMP